MKNKTPRKNPNPFKVLLERFFNKHLGEINSEHLRSVKDRIALEEEVAKLLKRKMKIAFEAAQETNEYDIGPRENFSMHKDFNKWFNETHC